MEKVLFREEQRFSQWWMWLLFLISFTVPLVLIGVELYEASANNTGEVTTLAVTLGIIGAVGIAMVWGLLSMKLVTEIADSVVRFKFPPIINKWKRFDKSEIKHYEVREYKPIMEYGGWGIKAGRRKKGMAYNVSGNIGLQLHLKNGKKILIGTQKKQAIDYAMNKLIQKEMDNQNGKSSF